MGARVLSLVKCFGIVVSGGFLCLGSAVGQHVNYGAVKEKGIFP